VKEYLTENERKEDEEGGIEDKYQPKNKIEKDQEYSESDDESTTRGRNGKRK
jgi:hypothetical protein